MLVRGFWRHRGRRSVAHSSRKARRTAGAVAVTDTARGAAPMLPADAGTPRPLARRRLRPALGGHRSFPARVVRDADGAALRGDPRARSRRRRSGGDQVRRAHRGAHPRARGGGLGRSAAPPAGHDRGRPRACCHPGQHPARGAHDRPQPSPPRCGRVRRGRPHDVLRRRPIARSCRPSSGGTGW